MSETPNEEIELSEQDKADLEMLSADPPTMRPILYIWKEVLSHAPHEATLPITPQFATKMVNKHPEVRYRSMLDFRDSYYSKMIELAHIIDVEISTDEECLSYTTAEEDLEHNSEHYKNIILAWNMTFLDWELSWDCMDDNAGLEVAVLSELYDIFFGPTSISAHLDNIKFDFTEDDQTQLAEALAEYRDSVRGAGE